MLGYHPVRFSTRFKTEDYKNNGQRTIRWTAGVHPDAWQRATCSRARAQTQATFFQKEGCTGRRACCIVGAISPLWLRATTRHTRAQARRTRAQAVCAYRAANVQCSSASYSRRLWCRDALGRQRDLRLQRDLPSA